MDRVETRYPPDIPGYTKGEISKALEVAKTVAEVIEGPIGKTGQSLSLPKRGIFN